MQDLVHGLSHFPQSFGAKQMAVRVDESFEIIQVKEHQTHFDGFGIGSFDESLEIAMQVTSIFKTGYVIRDCEFHYAVMFFFELLGPTAHAEKVGNTCFQFAFVQRADEQIVNDRTKVTAWHAAAAAHGEQKEWEENGCFFFTTGANFGA